MGRFRGGNGIQVWKRVGFGGKWDPGVETGRYRGWKWDPGVETGRFRQMLRGRSWISSWCTTVILV